MLRASAETEGIEVDARAVVDPARDSGISAGRALLFFTDVLVGEGDLAGARTRLVDEIGPEAAARAAAVVANFEMMNRVLDAGQVRVPASQRAFLAEVGLPTTW